MKQNSLNLETKLIHGAKIEDNWESVVVPIYQTATFRLESVEKTVNIIKKKEKGYIYSRVTNPTVQAFEQLVASLENGIGAIATNSGMSAIALIFNTFLEKGKHIICSSFVYGQTRGILEKFFSKFGVEISFVDSSQLNEIKEAINEKTVMIFIETPANPSLKITDIEEVAKIAYERDILLVVDNTFSSFYIQQPLTLGADIVLHSVTKFINGHTDLIGGIIVVKDEENLKKLMTTKSYFGANMDPHQAYLAIRGLKTLGIRIKQAQDNAEKIADFLSVHSEVAWVKYPNQKHHEQYDLIKKQMKGAGSMIAFGLKGGYEAAKKLMNNLELIILAVSLGGVETVIEHPASMTHSTESDKVREQAEVSDDLIRLSVGIEDVNDIINDLKNALNKIKYQKS